MYALFAVIFLENDGKKTFLLGHSYLFFKIVNSHNHLCLILGGCFVTKVSPDGSAAKSRKVMVGDQLASINGTSGSKMRVDDICDAVTRSSDQGQVDLIFLRYIGPFRPSNTVRRPKEGSTGPPNTIHYKHQVSNTSRSKKPTKKLAGFRLFGRGKKNSNKSNEA